MPGWEGRVRLDKDERKIVRRHLQDLAQFQPVKRGLADEVFYVAHAPARIPPLKVRIEGGVGRRRVCPAQHEGPVEEENPVRPQETARAGKEPEGVAARARKSEGEQSREKSRLECRLCWLDAFLAGTLA